MRSMQPCLRAETEMSLVTTKTKMADGPVEMGESKFNSLEEVSFTSIPSQTNMYGLAKIQSPGERDKVLLASLRGSVICVEFSEKSLEASTKDLSFTYIPGDAEIVSIDAFSRPNPNKGLVVGISLILLKKSLSRQKQFLNIYSAVEPGQHFCLDSIAEGCQHIELDFVPFQLTHTEIVHNGTREAVFLLGGSDKKVHLFCEDKKLKRFDEQPLENFFPELQDLPSNVLWLDIHRFDDSKRITALGCQNGYVKVAIVHTSEEATVTFKSSIEHDVPISCVRLFAMNSRHSDVLHVLKGLTDLDCGEDGEEVSKFRLVVSCAIEPTVVYRDLNLTSMVTLPDSDKYDCVVCACVADVDWDGVNEIVLGTYGQELLVYKCIEQGNLPESRDSGMEFRMLWRRSFSSPLFSVDYFDLTNDGLREMVVASLSGLHVLQHNLQEAAAHCASRLKELNIHKQELVT